MIVTFLYILTCNFSSPEELEELSSNEAAFDIFFESLDRVKNLKTFQEDLRNGNEQLAR